MAIRSAPLGALAALALGAWVTATVPAAAQGANIAGSWPQGGNIAGSWPSGQAAARNTGGSAPGVLAGSAFAPNNFRSCHWQNWPLYDVEGNFAGYQPVQVCN
jgi:hypothetical protein